MKHAFVLYTLLVSTLFTASAGAHPGHGAPGLWHHATDLGLWGLLVAVIIAVSIAVKRRSKR